MEGVMTAWMTQVKAGKKVECQLSDIYAKDSNPHILFVVEGQSAGPRQHGVPTQVPLY
jgi:Na+-transporting NADH:ubiquinone oxidoreductase subunit NqrF